MANSKLISIHNGRLLFAGMKRKKQNPIPTINCSMKALSNQFGFLYPAYTAGTAVILFALAAGSLMAAETKNQW
jgi:hypothetical protein